MRGGGLSLVVREAAAAVVGPFAGRGAFEYGSAALARWRRHAFCAVGAACVVDRGDALSRRDRWRRADVVYCCWTAFPPALRARFARAFASELGPGAVVAVLSHAVETRGLVLAAEHEVRCSWAPRVPAFVYRVARD